MKGYFYMKHIQVIKPEQPVTERAYVKCTNCETAWHELHTFYTSIRINSAIPKYAFCDNCVHEADLEEGILFENNGVEKK
jgi:hypothetical protein